MGVSAIISFSLIVSNFDLFHYLIFNIHNMVKNLSFPNLKEKLHIILADVATEK